MKNKKQDGWVKVEQALHDYYMLCMKGDEKLKGKARKAEQKKRGETIAHWLVDAWEHDDADTVVQVVQAEVERQQKELESFGG